MIDVKPFTMVPANISKKKSALRGRALRWPENNLASKFCSPTHIVTNKQGPRAWTLSLQTVAQSSRECSGVLVSNTMAKEGHAEMGLSPFITH